MWPSESMIGCLSRARIAADFVIRASAVLITRSPTLRPRRADARSACSARGRLSALAGARSGEQPRGVALNPRALEKVRVDAAMQPDRIGKHQLAVVVRADQPFFDQLVGLGRRLALIVDVEMADVGTENRIEATSERIAESEHVEQVFALASEVEVRDE